MITRSLTPDTFFQNALPALEELIFSDYEAYPDIIPVLSNYKAGTGWGAQTAEQTGVQAAVIIPEGSQMFYDDIDQGNSKTFTFVKWGIGVKVTEEMIEDDKWDQVSDIYRSLGASMFHSRQQTFMDNFNNGFTVNGYDGVPFFSLNHPLIKAGGIQPNTPTTQVDIGVSSLRAALTTIAGWLTHEGLKAFFKPRFLLVTTTNIYDAHELTKSDYRPGTANNEVNAFSIYNLEYVASPYLTDADAWFIGCRTHKLMFYDRQAPRTKSFEDFDAGALKTKITSRFDTGEASWYGWYGSAGA